MPCLLKKRVAKIQDTEALLMSGGLETELYALQKSCERASMPFLFALKVNRQFAVVPHACTSARNVHLQIAVLTI